MNMLIKINKKFPSQAAKTTFDRLRSRIEGLKNKIKNAEEECEKALLLYHNELRAKEKQLIDLISRFILKAWGIGKDPKTLTKKEQQTLRNLLAEDLGLLLSLAGNQDLDEGIKEVYQDLHGKSVEQSFQEEFTDFQNSLYEEGLVDEPLDLKFDFKDGFEGLMNKFGEAIKNQQMHNEEAPPKPKTKKELLKEEKRQQLEALQKKGIGNIYKRLAKELHPDLEQDPEKREEKDLLMRQLTVAYENRDLIALLTLEAEWLGNLAEDEDILSEDTVKTYNLLLKDQIIELEAQLKLVALHPRYFDIQRYIQNEKERPVEAIHGAIEECHNLMDQYSCRVRDIFGKNPIQSLKEGLRIFALRESDSAEQLMAEELLDLIDFFSFEPKKGSNKGRRRK